MSTSTLSMLAVLVLSRAQRTVLNRARAQRCSNGSCSAVLVLSHAQNAVVNAEHAPWSTELTYFLILR